MDKNLFLKTVAEVLKYDDKYCKAEYRDALMKLISRSKVNFVPQYEFANHGRSNQHLENIELRTPVPLLNEARVQEKNIKDLFEYVYEEDNDFALYKIEIRPLVIDEPEEIKEYTVVFNEIEDTIIQGIRDAKFIIWAAVAWFSNEKILNELKIKKQQGLNIRIIVSNEKSNSRMIGKLEANDIEVTVIEKWGNYDYNRMHDKFCIIDLDYVMHGSYNWTPTANYNKETLSTALARTLVSEFAKEFMELYNGIYF
ncbi:phospholipase D-like domain-containing protein [Solobacterium sp.]|uniref:phospholipase D-like domain-containing protein n=1 Tax=Solobacterium sp. TaxID=2060878 RepID=UPI001CB226EF|nr:phospholipase D-like domain-containing protein [Solobacterium sp.]MBF1085866.1 DUF1669 domain-containing protein [Solobacterium sp.]